MFNLYDNLRELCKERGITPSKLCIESGVSKSTASQLKNGAINTVNLPTAKKWADYLGVDVDVILHGKQKKTTVNDDDGLSDEQRELISMIRDMPDEEFAKKLPVIRSILDM